MAHIGEILFALATDTSASAAISSAGLSWTRDAVELAESTLERLPSRKPPPGQRSTVSPPVAITTAKRRCVECLVAGMHNWEQMVAKLCAADAAAKGEAAIKGGGQHAINARQITEKGSSGWRDWFWREDGVSERGIKPDGGSWVAEVDAVRKRKTQVLALLRDEGFNDEGELEAEIGRKMGWAMGRW